jgi:hypothetical protein
MLKRKLEDDKNSQKEEKKRKKRREEEKKRRREEERREEERKEEFDKLKLEHDAKVKEKNDLLFKDTYVLIQKNRVDYLEEKIKNLKEDINKEDINEKIEILTDEMNSIFRDIRKRCPHEHPMFSSSRGKFFGYYTGEEFYYSICNICEIEVPIMYNNEKDAVKHNKYYPNSYNIKRIDKL